MEPSLQKDAIIGHNYSIMKLSLGMGEKNVKDLHPSDGNQFRWDFEWKPVHVLA